MMDPKLHSTSEAGAYRMLHDVVAELEHAVRVLVIVQEAAPDAERRHHLEAIRAAIATLRAVVPPLSGDSARPDQAPTETLRDLQRQGEIPSP